MTNKWRVKYEEAIFFDDNDEICRGYRWCVTSPHGVPWGNYATWQEAMTKADTQARTMTVVLPRKPGMVKISSHKHSIITRTGDGDVALYLMDDTGRDQIVFMKTEYLEPFALALLAHTRKTQ